MTQKALLVLLTLVAVVSDSLLHPFFPQYFRAVFGVDDARYVGAYIAACSLTVLLAFPLWARVARRIDLRRLLIATQLGAGGLSLLCAAVSSLLAFWLISLGMLAFKASYLLVYPELLAHENEEEQLGTISWLAFVVYFGHVLAALLSGAAFEWLNPRQLFTIMACGDGVGILICLFWRRASRPVSAHDRVTNVGSGLSAEPVVPSGFVARLGSVMFVMYFSAYLSEPFFAAYWEQVSALEHHAVSGVAFAVPGLAALFGLYANSRLRAAENPYAGVALTVLTCVAGLWLQASHTPTLILAARFVYGWALFQAMVRLDSLLFRFERPEHYAVEFSKIYLFQGLGVLFASLAAGSLVSFLGMRTTFFVAAGGFLFGAGLYCALFRNQLWQRSRSRVSAAAPSSQGVVS